MRKEVRFNLDLFEQGMELITQANKGLEPTLKTPDEYSSYMDVVESFDELQRGVHVMRRAFEQEILN